jgi:hypothetical protein
MMRLREEEPEPSPQLVSIDDTLGEGGRKGEREERDQKTGERD